MNDNQADHKNLTLLITHFNRSQSLERLLNAVKSYRLSFAEIIVSDGGSKDEHLNAVKKLQTDFKFTLLTTAVNKGLGNSINVGQDAAKTPFILYIQEDFVPTAAFGKVLANGMEIIEQEPEWDIVRFYSFPWAPFPYLKPYKDGFSKMVFSLLPWYSNHVKFYYYSDHPHIKRKTFPDKFGRYIETLNGDVTELGMCRTFLKRNGKGIYYVNFKELFEHVNSTDEPGTVRIFQQKTKKFSDLPPLYWLYLKFKLLKETVSYVLDKQ